MTWRLSETPREQRERRWKATQAANTEGALRRLVHKLQVELKDLNEAIEELGYCCEVKEFSAQRKENCNDCCAHIGGDAQ